MQTPTRLHRRLSMAYSKRYLILALCALTPQLAGCLNHFFIHGEAGSDKPTVVREEAEETTSSSDE